MSHKPGIRYLPLPSMTRAPRGTAVMPAGEMAAICAPSMTTVISGFGAAPVPSMTVTLRTTSDERLAVEHADATASVKRKKEKLFMALRYTTIFVDRATSKAAWADSKNDRVAECRQVGHPIEIDVAVGMIDLVLENAGREAVNFHFDRCSFVIETAKAHLFETRNFAAEEWDAEAAFPVGDRLAPDRLVRGVEEHPRA